MRKEYCDRCNSEVHANPIRVYVYREVGSDDDYEYVLCEDCKGMLDYFFDTREGDNP